MVLTIPSPRSVALAALSCAAWTCGAGGGEVRAGPPLAPPAPSDAPAARACDGGASGRDGGAGGRDGGGAGACAFSACGGDPTGAWRLTASCSPPEPYLDPRCAQAEGTVRWTFLGTVEFEARGRYRQAIESVRRLELTVPDTCLAGGTCADWRPAAQDGDGACAEQGRECRCAAELRGTGAVEGAWEVAGDTLTLVDASGGRETDEICVLPARLDLRDEAGRVVTAERTP